MLWQRMWSDIVDIHRNGWSAIFEDKTRQVWTEYEFDSDIQYSKDIETGEEFDMEDQEKWSEIGDSHFKLNLLWRLFLVTRVLYRKCYCLVMLTRQNLRHFSDNVKTPAAVVHCFSEFYQISLSATWLNVWKHSFCWQRFWYDWA